MASIMFISEHSVKTARSRLRKKLNIKQDIPMVLSFGNIREYKGVDILIQAFAIVRNELPDASSSAM